MRLIDADALKKEISENKKVAGRFIEGVLMLIDNAPTVTPKQGEWLFHRCSLCGRYDARDNENFCSNCGADMRKGGA